LLILGGVVLDDGDPGLPHGGLRGGLLRARGQVGRFLDEGVDPAPALHRPTAR
jgi:hypothetical protein